MPTKQATSPPRLEAPTAPPSNGHAAPAAPEWPGLDVDLDRFRRDLGPMCERVAAWASEHSPTVRAVYAYADPEKLTVYVMTDQPGRDFELWDEWFDFDRGLVDEFPDHHVEIRPVTPGHFDGTVNGHPARRIYGDA